MRYETVTMEDGKQFIIVYIDENNVTIFEVDENNPEYSSFINKITDSE